jgi:flagella basal body P-ring formation protein FlgA
MKTLSTLLLAAGLLAGHAQAGDSLASLLQPVSLPEPAAGGGLSTASNASAPADASHLVTEREITAKLEKVLGEQLTHDGVLQLTLARPWQPIRVPSEDWSLVVPQLPIGGLARSFMVGIRIMAKDRAWYNDNVIVLAQLMKPVLVASRRLERGQLLDQTAAEVRTVDILSERQAPIAADTELADNQVLQTIEVGEILNWKTIGTTPLVKKGSVVDVVANEGGISITMKGLALQTGGEGDAISVRNPDTRKEFQGRVVSKNTVRVSF